MEAKFINGSSDRLDRIEQAIFALTQTSAATDARIEALAQIVSENRANIAAANARMDALIQTIAESTARTGVQLQQTQLRIDAVERLIAQNEQRITRLEETNG